MKTLNSKWIWRLGLPTGLVTVCVLVLAANFGGKYIAHEWGTFTSVQGADGQLLEWHPLESSRLPKFVYDWQHPGRGRRDTSGIGWGKSAVSSLQRMETPVIYFYADREQTVDVSVKFPKGVITEWYPQADRIGPSTVVASPFVAQLDDLAQKAGAKPGFTLAAFFRNHADKESRAQWSHVQLRASGSADSSQPLLPTDASGSHYFAARATDANYLEVQSPTATNAATEHEKFIFYRGVGNFETPLRVTMVSSNTIILANISQAPLAHLFVLDLQNRVGTFACLDHLGPGQDHSLRIDTPNGPFGIGSLSQKLASELAKALVQEGLYRREATAMVNTWRDSWFEEDGLRVLYVLPRAWTDRILPLKLEPAPRQLIRVMVGRAEILPDSLEERLSTDLAKSQAGDLAAQKDAAAEFKKLGRFAEPALRLATKEAGPEARQQAWELLNKAAASGTKTL